MPLKGGKVFFGCLGWLSADDCLNSVSRTELEGLDFSSCFMRVANKTLVWSYCVVSCFMMMSRWDWVVA